MFISYLSFYLFKGEIVINCKGSISVPLLTILLTTNFTFYTSFLFQTEPVFRHTVYILLLTCSLLSYLKLYIPTEEESLDKMGMTCVVITVIMFGSPLVALANIFRSKSTESLSFPLSVMTVVNSSLWTSYGYLINDVYVIVSTFILLGRHRSTSKLLCIGSLLFNLFFLYLLTLILCFSKEKLESRD